MLEGEDRARALAGSRPQRSFSRATPLERDPIHVVERRLLRFLQKKMIELGPVPVRVGDLVVRARGDEKLVLPVRGVRERPPLRRAGRS